MPRQSPLGPFVQGASGAAARPRRASKNGWSKCAPSLPTRSGRTTNASRCWLLRQSSRKDCPSREQSLSIPSLSRTPSLSDRSPCPPGASRSSSVLVMDPGEDRGLLAEPLVRARALVVADVLGDDALEVPVVEHEDVR